jgi:release factor glutamine methyltransferase
MRHTTVRAEWRRGSEAFRRALVLGYLRFTERNRAADVRVVAGVPFLCLPSVFPPDSFTTALVLRNVEKLRGQRVLEIGCGAGAFAVFAARCAQSVVAADVSEEAVQNTRLNLEWHKTLNVEVSQSDLFAQIKGTFDTIVFNAPFFPGKAANANERMWLSDNGQILQRFLRDAPQHLAPDGRVWLTHSSVADELGFRAALDDAGWTWSVMDERDIFIETFKLYRATPMAKGGKP